MEPIRVRRSEVDELLFVPLLLKPRDAARLLAIGQRKLWELTACRDIPCVRIGKAVRYDPRDLTAFIDQQKKHK